MPYTPEEPGLYGQTYSVTLNEGENYMLGEVAEPGLIFERLFMVCTAADGTSAGILVQRAGGDSYVWKVSDAATGLIFQDMTFGFIQGSGLRLFCQLGTAIYSWRERFRLGV